MRIIISPAILSYEGIQYKYMAENNITDIEEIKSFDRLGYEYNQSLSKESEYIFIKN